MRILLLTLALLLTSCSSLKMGLINSSVQKPSNVALFFSVETANQMPVAGLPAESFRIYEDDQLISPFESKQTILNQEMSVIHYTILLLDLSGSITESGNLPALVQAATLFAERVSKNQKIAVMGFDGGSKLIPVVQPTNNMATITSGLQSLTQYKVQDPSTNLNGAMIEAIRNLQNAMNKATQPLRFGSLVVFTDGTDRAHRVSDEEMHKVVHESDINVFAIGLGAEISTKQLAKMSTLGYMQANNMTQIALAFANVADLIEATSRKFYLLSYCSPSRAGKHSLRVEVMDNGVNGQISQEFDATGFGPNCSPDQKPNFKSASVRMGAAKLPDVNSDGSLSGVENSNHSTGNDSTTSITK